VGAVVVGDAARGLALTGMPDIQEKAAIAAPATEPVADTNRSAPLLAIGLAALTAIGLTILATRTFALRRREPSATPVP
jgi:hypothetical protein